MDVWPLPGAGAGGAPLYSWKGRGWEDANGFPAGGGSVRTWDPFIRQVPAQGQDFLVRFSVEIREAKVRAT